MKTIKYTALTLLTLLAVCACENEISSDSRSQEGDSITKTFRATFADLTKTTVSSTGRVSWQAGDVISYYSTNGGTIGTFTVEKDTSAIELTANVGKDDLYFVALYGGTSISDNKGSELTVSGVLPSAQSGKFSDGQLSVAKTHDMALIDLQFRHLTSFVKFSLAREDVNKISFRANDFTPICSDPLKITFDLNSDEPSLATVGSGSSVLTLKTEGSGTFYIATLPVELENGFQIVAYDKDGNRLGSVMSKKSVTLKAGGMLDLGLIDDRITTISTPIYDDPVVDMTGETANCYIVAPNSELEFSAVYQGNSTDSIGGNPAAVRVLWESFGTDVKPNVEDVIKSATYSKTDKTITVTTGSAGNAVVALIDWNEQVLWSWHIWVTDYDPSRQCNSYPWTVTDYMMDRNLGALSATPGDVKALGLLYQWGRKDPFLGSSSISSSIVAASTLDWPSYQSVPGGTDKVSFSIINPTTFISSLYMDDYAWSSTKSKYDPCPAGWRVPDSGDNGPWANFPSQNDWDDNWKGMVFGAAYCGSDVWYPAAGCRYYNDGSLYDVGNYGHCWSWAPNGNDYACSLGFGNDGGVYPTNVSDLRAFGQSVRCQSE